MKFLKRLFAGRGRGARGSGRPPSERAYVVDASGLVDTRSRNGNGQPPTPRDHFTVLKNLGQFAAREQIAMTAVFLGRPLREAPDGGQYKGVRVFYAESAAAQKQKILGLAAAAATDKDVLVITSDPQLERDSLARGAACMRLSTLKKAFDEREERGERGGDRGGDRGEPRGERNGERAAGRPAGPRRPGGERPASERAERPPQTERGDRPASSEGEPSGSATETPGVLDLIDPI